MTRESAVLQINRVHWQEIVNHLRAVYPQEGCGLLAGESGRSRAVLPVPNQLRSTHQFYMEPIKLLQALETIDQQVWELLAIFHSHPNGLTVPSLQDVEGYHYPDTPTLICFPLYPEEPDKAWDCRAYQIKNNGYSKLEFQIEA